MTTAQVVETSVNVNNTEFFSELPKIFKETRKKTVKKTYLYNVKYLAEIPGLAPKKTDKIRFTNLSKPTAAAVVSRVHAILVSGADAARCYMKY